MPLIFLSTNGEVREYFAFIFVLLVHGRCSKGFIEYVTADERQIRYKEFREHNSSCQDYIK